MNGIRNALYIVIIMILLIGFAFIFGIGDEIMNAIHAKIFMYPTADAMFNAYTHIRDFFVAITFNVALPFVIFTLFLSSFINRQENLLVYLMQTFAILMITPILVYAFAALLSNLTAIPILNPTYLASLYISNMLVILVANLLLSAASFVFTMKGGAQTYVS